MEQLEGVNGGLGSALLPGLWDLRDPVAGDGEGPDFHRVVWPPSVELAHALLGRIGIDLHRVVQGVPPVMNDKPEGARIAAVGALAGCDDALPE